MWYDIKVRGRLGGNPGDVHEITILNRIVRWNGPVTEFEADPKHVAKLCEELGLDSTPKGLDWPAVREVEDQIRVMKIALQKRLRRSIDTAMILPGTLWAWVATRHKKDSQGKSAEAMCENLARAFYTRKR